MITRTPTTAPATIKTVGRRGERSGLKYLGPVAPLTPGAPGPREAPRAPALVAGTSALERAGAGERGDMLSLGGVATARDGTARAAAAAGACGRAGDLAAIEPAAVAAGAAAGAIADEEAGPGGAGAAGEGGKGARAEAPAARAAAVAGAGESAGVEIPAVDGSPIDPSGVASPDTAVLACAGGAVSSGFVPGACAELATAADPTAPDWLGGFADASAPAGWLATAADPPAANAAAAPAPLTAGPGAGAPGELAVPGTTAATVALTAVDTGALTSGVLRGTTLTGAPAGAGGAPPRRRAAASVLTRCSISAARSGALPAHSRKRLISRA